MSSILFLHIRKQLWRYVLYLKRILIVNIFRGIVRFHFDIDFGGLPERDKFDKIVTRIVTYCSSFLQSSDRSNPKTRLSSRGFFFLLILAARNYQFRFLPCVFVTFHGPHSPQLENGTFERVNASVRDRRACPETKGPARFHAFAPMFPE